jgi:hypothetical protein
MPRIAFSPVSHGTGANIIGKSIFEVFPFLPPKIREEYRYVFNTGESAISERSIPSKDANVILEIRRIPIFSAGKVVRVVTIVRDITEQKHAAAAAGEDSRGSRDHRPGNGPGNLPAPMKSSPRKLPNANAPRRSPEKAKHRFRSIVENTLEVIMLTQPDGIVSYPESFLP